MAQERTETDADQRYAGQYSADDKEQRTITLPKATIQRGRELCPHKIDDAEILRALIGDGIEYREAKSVTIERRD
jgi:hypothetical protein